MYFHPLSCWFVYTIQKLAEARELTRGEVNEPLDAADFECRAVISCTVNGDDRDVCVESAFLVSLCKTSQLVGSLWLVQSCEVCLVYVSCLFACPTTPLAHMSTHLPANPSLQCSVFQYEKTGLMAAQSICPVPHRAEALLEGGYPLNTEHECLVT